MILETTVCRFLVPVNRLDLSTLDADEISEWIRENLQDGFTIINFGVTNKITMGGTDVSLVEANCDALFCFATYEDALLFQMRFIG